MKVLVCGGRNFRDGDFIHAELDRLHGVHGFATLIEGDARGVDRIAGEWARSRGVDLIVYPAHWERDGRHAALIRNEHMLNDGKPDLVVAFPGGGGTSHTCWKAREMGIAVVKIDYDTPVVWCGDDGVLHEVPITHAALPANAVLVPHDTCLPFDNEDTLPARREPSSSADLVATELQQEASARRNSHKR